MSQSLKAFQGGLALFLLSTDANALSDRRQVYRNNVMYSLTQALAAQFPVIRRLVGADFFRALAADYVREEPPPDPVLALYGHHFAKFIARTPACQSLPWLADVAALELHCQRALHAADAFPLDPRELGALSPEHVATATLTLQPSATLQSFAYPVDRIWAANVAESNEEIRLDAGVCHLLVYRRAHAVQVVSLQPQAFALLQQLRLGAALGAACERVAQSHSLEPAAVVPLLHYLLALQVFSGLSTNKQISEEHS